MAITYARLTKGEATRLDPARYNPTNEGFADLRLAAARYLDDDDIVAFVALDGERIVGKMCFLYGWLPFDQQSIRLALAQDLIVSEQYRGRGLGFGIIERSLEMGLPKIFGGMASASAPLFARLGLPSIDRCPAFQLTLTPTGMLRRARTGVHTEARGRAAGIAIAAGSVRRQLAERRSVRLRGTGGVTLRPDEAIDALPSVLGKRERRFQIPWNRSKLVAGINGTDKGFAAWVVAVEARGIHAVHFVSAYEFERAVRLPFSSRSAPLREWRVNEIYPPVQSEVAAHAVIAAAARNLRARGADVVELYAETDLLASACRNLGLLRSLEKSMQIATSGVGADLARDLGDPGQWWCRAINEEQFEESQQGADLLIPA